MSCQVAILDALKLLLSDEGYDVAAARSPGEAVERLEAADFDLAILNLNTSNLFVPFFTTKPTGSGIGLALSRQIAEAHGGTLALENRTEARGCRAILRLPL